METIDWPNLLIEALHQVPTQFEPNELAYLTLTSMVEAPVRDALAWNLHQRLVEGQDKRFYVAREFSGNRFDLAVLEVVESSDTLALVDGPCTSFVRSPLVMEIKVAYGLNFATDIPASHQGRFDRDVEKLEGVDQGTQSLVGDTCAFLVVVINPLARIPEALHRVVKYPGRMNRAIKLHENPEDVRRMANRTLLGFLKGRYSEDVRVVSHDNVGVAFGVPVSHDYFLVIDPYNNVAARIY